MTNNQRPLSPHLQVYKPQLTSMLSILHRLTGFGLASGMLLMTWWLLAAASGEEYFLGFHKFAHSLIGQLLLFCWLFALVFHFMNGLRHMVWDTGRWLTLKSAYASGYAIFYGAIVITVLIWVCAG